MHAVFHNPALVTEIFSFLYEDGYSATHPSAPALTCKTFLSPALDCIWKHLCISAHPIKLVKLIKGVQIEECDDEDDDGEYTWESAAVDHPFSNDDVEVLKSYCRRVRVINYDLSDTREAGYVQPLIWTHLMTVLRDEPLFPRLQGLTVTGQLGGQVYHNIETRMSLYIPTMWSPMLERFSCDMQGLEDLWNVILFFLRRLLQMVERTTMKEVKFNVTNSEPDVMLQTVSALQSLKKLDLDLLTINVVDLQHLSGLDDLQEMNLKLSSPYDGAMFSNAGASAGTTTLSQVTVLRLTLSSGIMYLKSFIKFVILPALEELEITYVNSQLTSNKQEWERYFGDIVRWAPRIKKLSFSCNGQIGSGVHDRPEVPALPWSTFTPLLSLQLVEIGIRGPSIETFTNQDFLQMAKAWPELVSLTLKVHSVVEGEGEGGSADRESLLIASKYLPKLKLMDFPIRLLDGPVVKIGHDDGEVVGQCNLETLRLGELTQPPALARSLFPCPPSGKVSESHELAQMLHVLFPALRRFEAGEVVSFVSSNQRAGEKLGAEIIQEFLKCLGEKSRGGK